MKNSTITTLKAVKLSVLLLFVVWLLFAFGLWEMNPSKWDSDVRIFFSIVAAIVIWIAAGISLEN